MRIPCRLFIYPPLVGIELGMPAAAVSRPQPARTKTPVLTADTNQYSKLEDAFLDLYSLPGDQLWDERFELEGASAPV